MNRRLWILILFALVFNNAFTQTGFFIGTSADYPIITNQKVTEVSTFSSPVYPGMSPYRQSITIEETYSEKPGFNIYSGYSRKIAGNFSIETGIGISAMYYKRHFNVNVPSFNEINDSIYDPFTDVTIIGFRFDSIAGRSANSESWNRENPDFGKTSLVYLNIPLVINYSKNRWQFGAGFSASILLAACSNTTTIQLSGTSRINYEIVPYKDRSANGFTNLLLNGNLNLGYNLTGGLWIHSGYAHSFTPLYDAEMRKAGKAKSRIFRLELRYYF